MTFSGPLAAFWHSEDQSGSAGFPRGVDRLFSEFILLPSSVMIRKKGHVSMRSEAVDRVKLIFSLFDVNGNGYLEADDFERMASDVVQAAPDSDDAAKNAILAAFRRYWTTLATELDTNSDGRISLDEYVSCVLSPERFEETISDFAESLAALGDPDGDGLIERPVFVALMMAIGFERANIDALFDAFEPSASDQIKVTTWVAGIKDYYGPDKAGIAGDHLVGKTPA